MVKVGDSVEAAAQKVGQTPRTPVIRVIHLLS